MTLEALQLSYFCFLQLSGFSPSHQQPSFTAAEEEAALDELVQVNLTVTKQELQTDWISYLQSSYGHKHDSKQTQVSPDLSSDGKIFSDTTVVSLLRFEFGWDETIRRLSQTEKHSVLHV